jgi:hypothetical protein
VVQRGDAPTAGVFSDGWLIQCGSLMAGFA